MRLAVITLVVLAAATPARAEPAGALDAAAEGDAAAHRGVLFPTAWIDRTGTVSVDLSFPTIPVIGVTTVRGSVTDRIEIFGGAAWSLAVGGLWNDTTRVFGGGVRAQVVRRPRLAGTLHAAYGRKITTGQDDVTPRRHDDHYLAVGIAASACVDAACRWVGTAQVSVSRDIEPEDDYKRADELGTLTLVGGGRFRLVAELAAAHGAPYEVAPAVTGYAGLRVVSRHVSVDLGGLAALSPLSYPVPLVGVTGRF